MKKRYERNSPALSPEEGELLRTKRAAVIGCGGLGGYLIEYLARIGVGTIVAVDGDVFEESNLNRQMLATAGNLGTSKAEAAARRVREINPEIRVQAVHAFLTEDNARSLIRGCDAVLDGLDSIPARRVLARACAGEGIPLFHGAIQGWVAQAAMVLPGDGLMELLYPAEVALTDKSVLSFTPALCAAMQTSLCVKWLTGRAVESGKLYYYDLLHQEFEEIPMI